MIYKDGDRLLLKTPREPILVLRTWPDFATALAHDPGGLGPLEEGLPDGFNKLQGFYSIAFADGRALLVGEEQIGDLVDRKLEDGEVL